MSAVGLPGLPPVDQNQNVAATAQTNQVLQLMQRIAAALENSLGASGVINSALTPASTPNTTALTLLQSFSIGSAFQANGILQLSAGGTFASDTHTKTVALHFGSLVLSNGGVTTNGGTWSFNITIWLQGIGAQTYSGSYTDGSGTIPFYGTTTQTGSPNIALSIYGQNGTASIANEIICNFLSASYQGTA